MRPALQVLAALVSACVGAPSLAVGGQDLTCRDTSGAIIEALPYNAFPAPMFLEEHWQRPDNIGFRQCLPVAAGAGQDLREVDAAVRVLTGLPRLGAYFADVIASSGVAICVDPAAVEGRGWFEPETNVLSVNAGLPLAVKALIIAHELRHVDQYHRGFRLSLRWSASEHVRQTFALEADASAVLAYAAWTSRTVGTTDLWPAALALDPYQDISAAFNSAIEATADPKAGLLAGFRAWYASEWRTIHYYRSSCGTYLDRVDEDKAVAGGELLPPDHFDGLCVVPGVGDYGCARTAEIAGVPTPLARTR